MREQVDIIIIHVYMIIDVIVIPVITVLIVTISQYHRKQKLRKQQSILDLTALAVFKSTSLQVLFCPYNQNQNHAFIIPATNCPQIKSINENMHYTFNPQGIIGFFIFWGSILTKLFYQPVLEMWKERQDQCKIFATE